MIKCIRGRTFIINAVVVVAFTSAVVTIPILMNRRASLAAAEQLNNDEGITTEELKAELIDFSGTKFWRITVVGRNDREIKSWPDIKDDIKIKIKSGADFLGVFEVTVSGIIVAPNSDGNVGTYIAEVSYNGLTVEISNQAA
jgi:hypothetical protein